MNMQIAPQKKLNYFHLIPEFLLYDTSYGNGRVLFQMSLKNSMENHWSLENNSPFVYHSALILGHLGIKSDYHRSGASKQLHDFIKLIEEKGFVEQNEYITRATFTSYNLILDKNGNNSLFVPKNKYGIIYNFEFLHLIELHKSKLLPKRVNLQNLLLVLAYLREKIILRHASDFNNSKNTKKKPETYVVAINEIAELLCLQEATVAKCIDFLDAIGIIYHEQLYRKLDCVDRVVYGRTLFANKYKYSYSGGKGSSVQTDYNYIKEVNEAKRQLKPYGEFGKKLPNSSIEIDD